MKILILFLSQWKSPEEQENPQSETFLSEKIDIYALGNIFYTILVGESPWRNNSTGSLTNAEKGVIAAMKRKGEMPPIPLSILQNKDPINISLLQVVLRCYKHDPKERPTAKEIASFFNNETKALRIHHY